MNQSCHAVKAQIIDRLRHDEPRPADVIAQLNRTLDEYERLMVAGVGLLAVAPVPELSRAHTEDIRAAIARRNRGQS